MIQKQHIFAETYIYEAVESKEVLKSQESNVGE
jgi:hypothetical protein